MYVRAWGSVWVCVSVCVMCVSICVCPKTNRWESSPVSPGDCIYTAAEGSQKKGQKRSLSLPHLAQLLPAHSVGGQDSELGNLAVRPSFLTVAPSPDHDLRLRKN